MFLQYIFKNTDFSSLSRLLSPKFFKIISPPILLKIITQLKQNKNDQATWKELTSAYSALLEQAQLKIHLPLDIPKESKDTKDTKVTEQLRDETISSQERGERLLILFFHQIFTQSHWILDFRTEAFKLSKQDTLLWNPKSYYYSMSPKFLRNIRKLYQGFYRSDDQLFDETLVNLGLFGAKKSLKNHFGTGDQSRVSFHLKTFQNTFLDVFEVCAREGIQVQTDFFILGIVLIGVYENLETLNLPLNVRKCFEIAVKSSETI